MSKLKLIVMMALITTTGASYGATEYGISNYLAQIFIDNNWFLVIPIAWIIGILLGLTPCAIPIILMMTNISDKHATGKSKTNSLAVTFLYLITLGLSYAAVGAVIALIGVYFYNYLYNIWVISSLSFVFMLLGFSALGLFNVVLFPRSWLQKIVYYTRWNMIGPYSTAIIMGLFGTLMAARCVIAPLAAILSLVAYKGDILFGAVVLFFTGIGFGQPVLVMHIFGSDIIQRAGKWQETIKHIFGLILLGVAIWLLDRIVENNITMFLWSGLAIFTPIYLGAIIEDEQSNAPEAGEAVCNLDGEESTSSQTTEKYITTILKMLGFMVMFYGIVLFIGALYGNTNPLSPLL